MAEDPVVELETLRRKVKDQTSEIKQLKGRVEEQDEELHVAKKEVTAAESKLQRAQATISSLEAELEKVKLSEKQLMMRLKQLSFRRDQSNVSLNQSSTMAPKDQSAARERATPQRSASPAAQQQQSSSSFASMAGVTPATTKEQLPPQQQQQQQQPQPVAAAPPQGGEAVWRLSAKVVFESYEHRVKIQQEEAAFRATILALHQSVLLETSQAHKAHAESLSRTSMTVSKLAEADEERRLEQFKELTRLREDMLMLERQKTVLSREVTSMDSTVSELEEQLRRANRERVEVTTLNEELNLKLSSVGAKLTELAAKDDATMSKENIMQNSELKAENMRLQDELHLSKRECKELHEKLASLRKEYAAAKKNMNLIIEDSIASREALVSEMREDKLLVSGMTTGTGNPVSSPHRSRNGRNTSSPRRSEMMPITGRGDTSDVIGKLQRRVADLEKTVEVKDAQVMNLSHQNRRKKQQQMYVDASVAMKDPYSKGLVRAKSSNSASVSVQDTTKSLLAKVLAQHDSINNNNNTNKAISQSELSMGGGLYSHQHNVTSSTNVSSVRAGSAVREGSSSRSRLLEKQYAPPLKHKPFHV